MKKVILRIIILPIIFILTLIIAGRILNQGHENITMEMAGATFPLISFAQDDDTPYYNTLHGYAGSADYSLQQDSLTVLSENRDLLFRIETYGNLVSGISYEVRSLSGDRLIEKNTPDTYELSQDGKLLTGKIVLKDLLEYDREYSLRVDVRVNDTREIHFYTKVIWPGNNDMGERLSFISDFHDKLFNEEQAKTLSRYLEPNAGLNDNSDFAHVDIHSSLKQVTYGELGVYPFKEPVITLKDSAGEVSTFLVDYMMQSGRGDDKTYYFAEELYRIRYTPERVYLLDYRRTMDRIVNSEDMPVNDKIVIGISSGDIEISESEDGRIMAFVYLGRLFGYNTGSGKFADIFSFDRSGEPDLRTLYGAHDIKVLDIDEAGNITFAVYGYMNGGRHEGEVGIEIYVYSDEKNTIEEIVYIPYDGEYGVLKEDLERLLYLNRNGHLYVSLENSVLMIDLEKRSVESIRSLPDDDAVRTSIDHRLLVVTENSEEEAGALKIRNLMTESEVAIRTETGDSIRFIGFIGQDLVYGMAHRRDIYTDNSGHVFYPMYRICICDEYGKPIKNYENQDVYVTDCLIKDNQILLTRVSIDEDRKVKDVSPDQITTSAFTEEYHNYVTVTAIDVYKKYTQIQLLTAVNKKSLKITYPMEVVYEGGRSLEVILEKPERFYIYDGYGLEGIYNLPAPAITEADSVYGRVIAQDGSLIWRKGSRASKNQIMSIEHESVTEDKNSVAVCLDSMMKYKGIIRNSDYLLMQGQTPIQILSENMPEEKILKLYGSSLDNILYYVAQDIPVIALLGDDTAVMVIGYNDQIIVALDPTAEELKRISIDKAKEMFELSGNMFVTYVDRQE